ncbi:MAG: hypothetical protein ACYTG0_07915 [Planctomycetota bacterium]|jgi:hypothetical protein
MRALKSSAWLIVVPLLLAPAVAAEPAPMLPKTTPPIVYVINYTDEYFTEPEYTERFTACPPDLLHMGKATPITHLWGPVRMLRGENQYTGGPGHTLNWDNVALISPKALAERIETIRRTLRRYHEIGIREIVPYISYHTLAGDHQKRHGFWNFYDHWETYRRWAGPRPAHEPFDWLVVDAQGKFVGGSCGGYSPDYYAPLHRYRACINHPDWAEWHRRLIRLIAEVGYDGCFVDNTHPDPCYCRYCKAAFREFLDERGDLHWVRRLTEGLEAKKLELDSPDIPAELVRRVRLCRTRGHLGMLRETGRRVSPEFTIFPNGNSTAECLLTGARCDRLMFESTYSPGIMATRRTATITDVAIEVVAAAVEAKPFVHRYDLSDPSTWIEMEAEIAVPLKAQVGRPVVLEVRVTGVGGSESDNDFAKDFHLVLREATTGEEFRVPLEPPAVLGAAGPSGEGKRPPAVLKATWTPSRPGRYLPHFGCTYTDGGHIQNHPHMVRLDRSHMCRTHIGTLMFTQHMHARPIFLGYETRRTGWENAAELGLAEMAAFGGGGGYAAWGPVQAKYRAFFTEHPELFDGWRPCAPAAVLFARWGGNPLTHVRPVARPTIHDHLAATQRPFVPLLDTVLPEDAGRLEDFQVVYLQASEYDVTTAQLRALTEYVRRGGWLVALNDQIAVNGRSSSELFGVSADRRVVERGRGRIVLWDSLNPTAPTSPLFSAEGIQRNLRLALYRKDDRLALHVVNYNVCLLEEEKSVLEVRDVEVRLPLPKGWTAAAASSFDPDAPRRKLDCTVAEGHVRFSLPKVHLYKIVLLEGQSVAGEIHRPPETSS